MELLRCLVMVLSVALISSECHYDFRHGRTECTHHDGSKWSSGQMVEAVGGAEPSTVVAVEAAAEKRRDRAIDRSAVALSMAAKTKQGLLEKKTKKDRSAPFPFGQVRREGIARSKDGNKDGGGGGGGGGSPSSRGSPWVVSCFDRSCGRPWLDSRGKRIEAHGGGMLQAVNGTYYW